MKLKNTPLSTIPILLFILVLVSFVFVLKGGDLISEEGDFLIGSILGKLLALTVFIDLFRLILRNLSKKKINKEN